MCDARSFGGARRLGLAAASLAMTLVGGVGDSGNASTNGGVTSVMLVAGPFAERQRPLFVPTIGDQTLHAGGSLFSVNNVSSAFLAAVDARGDDLTDWTPGTYHAVYLHGSGLLRPMWVAASYPSTTLSATPLAPIAANGTLNDTVRALATATRPSTRVVVSPRWTGRMPEIAPRSFPPP